MTTPIEDLYQLVGRLERRLCDHINSAAPADSQVEATDREALIDRLSAENRDLLAWKNGKKGVEDYYRVLEENAALKRQLRGLGKE
jgi:hypothetical protein